MAVFTALRNQARSTIISTASGLVNATLARATQARPPSAPFSRSDVGERSGISGIKAGGVQGGVSQVLQYPLDLTSVDQPHFIAFFLMKKGGKNKVKTGATQNRPPSNATADEGGPLQVTSSPPPPVLRPTIVQRGDQSPLVIRGSQAAEKVLVQTPTGGSFNVTARGVQTHESAIAMYFPPSLQHSYNLSYNDEEIGNFALAGASIIESFIRGGGSGGVGGVIDALTNLAQDPNFKETFRSGVNRQLIGLINSAVAGAQPLLEIASGKIFAPKMEVMFDGIQRRKFSFSFIMNPTSEREAVEIHKIVQAFRHHSAADYASNDHFRLNIPDTFRIEYYCNGTVVNDFITRTEECYLESVDVNYGGDKAHFHEQTQTNLANDFLGNDISGAPPTRTTLNLNFVELPIITKSKIAEGF